VKRWLIDLKWNAIVFCVLGVVGAVSGWFWAYIPTDLAVRLDKNARLALRAECIKGNDRACRMYEVDYGRE